MARKPDDPRDVSRQEDISRWGDPGEGAKSV